MLDRLLTLAAAGPLDHPAWESAFAEAVTAVRDQVRTEVTQWVEAAGRASRAPAGRLRTELPDAAWAEALLNRLLACAMPLERLAGEGSDLLGRRTRGAALEGAWEAAEALAQAELRRWRQRATALAEWRRPLGPVAAWAGGLAVVMAVVSAWLGGQLTPPEWFRPVHTAFWSLPWP